MQTVSDNWNTLLSSKHSVEFKAVIAGKTYDYSSISSAKITKSMMQNLSIGNANAATLTMTFKPAGNIPKAAKIECYVRLNNNQPLVVVVDEAGNVVQTDDGYILASSYPITTDWIPFGTFFIDTRSCNAAGWLTITAYDAMLKAEQDYIDNTGSYPMSFANAVTFIAEQLGVTTDSRNSFPSYTIDSPTGVYTIREVLQGIAAGSGGNFIITENNALRFIPLASPASSDNLPCSSCNLLSDSELTVSRVTLYPDSETEYTSGNDTGYALAADCQYATQAMTNYVANKLRGITYLPLSAQNVFVNPAVELGDSVKPNGNQTIIAEATFQINHGMTATISAPIDTEINHEYPYQSKSKEARQLASAYSEIKKTTDNLSLTVAGKVDGDDVQSAIDLNLNELSISYSGRTNGASITLSKAGVDITGTVKIGSINAGTIDVTNIDANNITTGELTADYIKLGGNMDIYKSTSGTTVGGHVGYGTGFSGDSGTILANNTEDCYFIATTKGARMQAFSNYLYCSEQVVGVSQSITVDSDRNLKEDINYDLSEYEGLIDKLAPCSFNYIGKNKRHLGFIAQDVDKSREELGIPVDDFGAVAQSDKGIYGIAYEEFIPLLINAIQKMQKRINSLEKAVNNNS